MADFEFAYDKQVMGTEWKYRVKKLLVVSEHRPFAV